MTDCSCRCHLGLYYVCDVEGGCSTNHRNTGRPDPCRSAGRTKPRVIKDRHRDDCTNETCKGCAPCTAPHCQVCGWRHLDNNHPRSCSHCVGEVRDDITEIVTLARPRVIETGTYPTLTEAVSRGINSAAAFLAGPTAHPADWYRRRRWVTYGGLCTCNPVCPDDTDPIGPACHDCSTTTPAKHPSCSWIIGPRCPAIVAWLDANRDENHPLWVLGLWDYETAAHYQHTREHPVDMDDSARYLTGHLTNLAQDEDFDFPGMAHQLRSCRTFLEDVLHAGERVEKGAPCWVCNDGTLVVKQHAEMTNPQGKIIKDPDGRPMIDDYWECPTCGNTWDIDVYDRLVKTSRIPHATELNTTDMAIRLNLPESTIRRWAGKTRTQRDGEPAVEHPPRLRSCGRGTDGRKLYRVVDVQALADARNATRPGADAS